MNRKIEAASAIIAAALSVGCGDPTSDGEGRIHFTTWGEDYIEVAIPAETDGETGFVDGWRLEYERFLVVIRAVTVADADGRVAAAQEQARVFDLTAPGVKTIFTTGDLDARRWDAVSYEIGPVDGAVELDDSVTEADLASLRGGEGGAAPADGGYGLRLVARATKGGVTKHLDWGFALATRYEACRAVQDGKDELGVVVTRGRTEDVQLTIHGDHPFYDRLEEGGAPAIETSLRFDAIAEADDDGDGEVTLEELDGEILDVLRYDPSGQAVTTLGGFIRALTRTVGHFRGEGECTVRAL